MKSTEQEDGVVTTVYQIEALHKKFPSPLNIIVICKYNTHTQKQSHIILFSTDLQLGYEEMHEYYRLRFQIEFNFRDAKQYWGLEDFMVTEKQAVFNSANIAFWMVNLSQALMPATNILSVLDLKTHYRGMKYANAVLKLLPKNAQPINKDAILAEIAGMGRINETKMAA